jgi:universal stress protein E
VKPIRRILVPIKDTRARSLPALAKAARLAKALGARVQLFHGIADRLYVDGTEPGGFDLAQLEERSRQERLAQLEVLARGLRRLHVPVTTAVEWDFPAHDAILRNARAFGADLIVLDAHPAPHRAPWLLRFTDWELLRLSAIPVLLVKKRAAYRRPKILAAIDPSHAFAKPAKLDGEILACAKAVTQALHGTLHVVHAYDPMPTPVVPSQLSTPEAFPHIQAQIASQARRELDRAVRSSGIPPARRHLIGRHPIDAIEEVAEATGSGIVVMGAISRSGLKRLIIGNTAEKVLDDLPCDLLIVKPRQFHSPVARAARGARIVPIAPAPMVL